MKKFTNYWIFGVLLVSWSCDFSEPPKTSEFSLNYNQEDNPCSYLPFTYLENKFPGASKFVCKSYEKPDPTCSCFFYIENDFYSVGLILTDSLKEDFSLEKQISYFDKVAIPKKLNKAESYYIPSHGQITTSLGQGLFHLFVQKNNQGQEQMAIDMTRDMLKLIAPDVL